MDFTIRWYLVPVTEIKDSTGVSDHRVFSATKN